jgi:hypothetical protein
MRPNKPLRAPRPGPPGSGYTSGPQARARGRGCEFRLGSSGEFCLGERERERLGDQER